METPRPTTPTAATVGWARPSRSPDAGGAPGVAGATVVDVPILDVDGLPTYFESTGDGPALVLLHGGIVASDSWGPWPELLAAGGYTVLTPDRRGHGGTPDVPGPITYGAMADDTIAFLRAAVGGPAHLVGWSDGAVVAALVSMRAPELVARQVLIGQYYSPTASPAPSSSGRSRPCARTRRPSCAAPIPRPTGPTTSPSSSGSCSTCSPGNRTSTCGASRASPRRRWSSRATATR
ncbi:alpha/beta fold hydrolase [Pseudonocardia benzenivorans]